MKFVEIVVPRNVDSQYLTDKVLINLKGILEIAVIPVEPRLRYNDNYSHTLVIAHESREIEFHGTKSDCDRGYKELRDMINAGKAEGAGIEKFVFPSPNANDGESGN